jgi:hypothetical protein
MGTTKKIYEEMTLQELIMERYYNSGDEDYQYQEYLEAKAQQDKQEMEYHFNNQHDYAN